MLNILVALRVCAKQWANNKILLKCDNQAVVSVLNSGKTQDLTLAAMARNINMLLAVEDIELQVIHILGSDNKVADLLSRWSITSNPKAKLQELIKNPLWLTLSSDILRLVYINSGLPQTVKCLAHKAAHRMHQAFRPATQASYLRKFRVFVAYCCLIKMQLRVLDLASS